MMSRGCLLALLVIAAVGTAVTVVVYISVSKAAVKDAVQTFTLQFAPDADRFADFFHNRQRALAAVADALSTGSADGGSPADAATFARVWCESAPRANL